MLISRISKNDLILNLRCHYDQDYISRGIKIQVFLLEQDEDLESSCLYEIMHMFLLLSILKHISKI